MKPIRMCCFLSVIAGASPAMAQLHAGDILLAVNGRHDRILTGLVDPVTAEPGYNRRVFLATFDVAPNFTNNPGFDSDVGIFPPSSSVGFTVLQALRVWQNGNFDTIPPERIGVTFGPLGPVLTPVDDTPVVGFSMAVNSEGQFHHHPGYTLKSPAGNGIYLYEVQVWSNVGSIQPSRPFWMVFNQNSDPGLQQAAADWLVGNVYCPADFNADGFIDPLDYNGFINSFEEGDIEADFNSDGFVDPLDYNGYINAFEAGC